MVLSRTRCHGLTLVLAGTNRGWVPVGGTSAATPIIAGIAISAGRFLPSSNDELH
jgi:subtilase family serine protease